MSAADEIRQLREELARLRERIAVLESRQVSPYVPLAPQPLPPYYDPYTPPLWPTIIYSGDTAGGH